MPIRPYPTGRLLEVARLSPALVPSYDGTVPPGLGAKPLRGNKSSQTFLNLVPFGTDNDFNRPSETGLFFS
jgi:hypothetical protein